MASRVREILRSLGLPDTDVIKDAKLDEAEARILIATEGGMTRLITIDEALKLAEAHKQEALRLERLAGDAKRL